MEYRNSDGGFGGAKGYPNSNNLDTAFALQALKAANYSDTAGLYQAINFLTINQNPDGGWGVASGGPSNTYVTAIVSTTLQQFTQTTALASAISKATTYLLAHQNTDGGFGNSPSTIYESALAYKALTNVITDATVLGNAVNYLKTTQLADGSWNDDPYSTALALQALHLSETRPLPPPPAPTMATVSGTVVDASTNQPLSGVSVQWSENGGQGSASATTSSSGAFTFTNITTGSQQITFTLTGYATTTATVNATAGSIINIGSVPLSVNPTTGIIQGTATDSSNGSSLSGVTITITGASTLTAVTDANGSFKITNISPGSYDISASKSSYTTVIGHTTVTAGETLVFSPALTPAALTGGLKGTVVDSATGLPIQGATLSATGAKNYTASSDSSGVFTVSAMDVGTYSVTVSLAGYGAQTFTVTVIANTVTNLGSITLAQNATTATVQGTITDAATGLPISGAGITISGSGAGTAVTALDGSYHLSGINPGALTITASKTGYDSVIGIGTVIAGGTLVYNIALFPTPPPAVTSDAKGVVINSSTGQAVAGAVVSMTAGTGPATTATTDANGAFIFQSLASGSYAISITAAGYISQAGTLTLMIVSGVTINLGTLPLSPALTTTTVTGKVTDAATGAGLPDVDVSIVGTTLTAKTDSTGAYTITGITTLMFTAKTALAGYDSRSSGVVTTAYGAFTVDFQLSQSGASTIKINSLTTDKTDYPAYADVSVTALIENTGQNQTDVFIIAEIKDAYGTIVALASPDVPKIAVPPLSSAPASFVWNTEQFGPGEYRIRLKAADPEVLGYGGVPGVVVLAEKSAIITIQPSVGIANGTMKSNPTFVYTGASAPVTLGLTVTNRSNVPANLMLEYSVKSPSGVDLATGSTSASLSLDIVTTTFPLTVVNTTYTESGEYPLHVVVYNNGAKLQELDGVFVVLSNIRIEPTRSVSPQALLPNGTGKVTTTIRLSGKRDNNSAPKPAPCAVQTPQDYQAEVFASGLSTPLSLRANGMDELYVVENSKDRILKVTPDGSVRIFAQSGPGTPLDFPTNYTERMDIDKNGNLYVGCAGGQGNPYNPYGEYLDTVYKITPDGLISVLASRYVSPNIFYDIGGLAVSPDGLLYLFIGDTFTPHDILKIDLTTNTSTKFATSVYDAYDLLFDKEGNLYVCMRATATDKFKIYRFAPDGTRTLFSDALAGPMAMAWGPDGQLYVLDSGSVYTIDPTTKAATVFATGFNNPVDIDFDSKGNMYVTEYQLGQIIKISYIGAVFTDVRLIDTIPAKDTEFVLSSATRVPAGVTQMGDSTVVEWRIPRLTTAQDQAISYELNLSNLVPGENRIVDRSLELTYTDLNNQVITVELPSFSVPVRDSAFTSKLLTDKTSYPADSDVGISFVVSNINTSAWNGTAEVLIEDAAGNHIATAGSFLVKDMKPAELIPWVYRIPATITAAWDMKDTPAEATVDFAAALNALGNSDGTLDKNSIKVLELDFTGNLIGEKQAKADFVSETSPRITWLLDGPTAIGVTRYFALCFDTLDNGPKTPSLNTKLPTTGKLIAFTDESGKVYTITGNGDGTFGTMKLVDDVSPATDNTRGIILDDFNEDGFADIITGSGYAGKLYFYQNKADGSNTFYPKAEIGPIAAGGFIMDMAGADFNGDGHKDFVVSGNSAVLYLYTGHGDGTFTATALPSPSGSISFRGKAAADVNNDGKMDLLAATDPNGALYLYEGNGDGTFKMPVQVASVGAYPYGLTAGDFDEDGNIDIIAQNTPGIATYLLKGNGAGAFGSPIRISSINISMYSAGFDAGDFNGDGHRDIIASVEISKTIEFYPGRGDGTFGTKTVLATLPTSGLGISSSPLLAEVRPVLGVPDMAAQTFNVIWNTGSTYAGQYQVHAVLTDGTKSVSQDRASFTIQPDMRASAQVTTDKMSYNPNETAAIASVIASKSVNYIMENLSAKLTIGSNSTIYTETKTIATLMPGASFNFKTYWNTGTIASGTYPVTLEVKDPSGAVIAAGTQNLVIASTVKPLALLKGQVTADRTILLSGETVAVSYGVNNVGNIDLSSIALSIKIVSVDEKTVYDTINNQASIPMGGSYTGTGTIDTAKYGAKDYLVVLQAKIAETEETLAGTYIRIEGAPTAPALNSPADGSDVLTFTPLLVVSNASDPNDDKIFYEFVLYNDSGLTQAEAYSGRLAAGTDVTGWTIPFPLTENHTYYWRARAFDGWLYGPWTAAASFRVNSVDDPPTAPLPTSPVDNAVVSLLTPVLTVDNASDPDTQDLTYNFDLALDPDFTQVVASEKGILAGQGMTSWQTPVSLTENVTYYWRAQADDWLIIGPWSATSQFFVNVTNEAPSAPVITAPTNNAEITALSADITVQNSADPDSFSITYTFEADIAAAFDSPGLVRSNAVLAGDNTTTWRLEGLKDNTVYYVRAKASDGQAESPWSAVTSFFANTANDPPTVPVVSNPSNGAGVTSFTPVLSVQDATDPDNDVLTYEFALYADAGLTTLVASGSNINETAGATSWTVPTSLIENQNYYWKARAFDSEAYSAWTPPASFMVNTANDAPGAPTISSPADGSSVTTLTPQLTVINAVDPDRDKLVYDFEVYKDGALVIQLTNIPENSGGITSVTLSTALIDNTVYQWRARAFDNDRYGPWTAITSFTVHIQQTGITAEIEFEPETLNEKSNGKWVKVEIELPHGYRASDIDISSIRLEGTVPAEPRPYEVKGRHHEHGCDHDHAGHSHSTLTVKFKRSAVIAVLPSGKHVPVHVTGMVGATTFEGVDIIRVLQ